MFRASWGSGRVLRGGKARLLFLLGTEAALASAAEADLQAENVQHGDLVREDFLDSYENLTLKTVAGLKWTSIFCPQVKYMIIHLLNCNHKFRCKCLLFFKDIKL
jgi:hypothetical protein